MRKAGWCLGAALAAAIAGTIAGSQASDIAPLVRSTFFVLQRPSIHSGIEHWQLAESTARAERVDAADGLPLRCTFIQPLGEYFTDPTIESIQVGLERNPATSRPDAFDGTMFIRVRFVDTTTWRPVAVRGLVALLRRGFPTAGWRVEPPDAEGYMTISKATALADREEKRVFGWFLADGGYRFRIARDADPPIREYYFDMNRAGDLDEAVFDNIDCLKEMGDDPIIDSALLTEDRLRANPIQVPPSRMR